MKHFYLLLSLLCAYAFAATTYEQCRKDVQTISKQITILQRDVSRVKSGSKGFAFALQVQVDAVTTKKTVDQATYDANHAPNFNDDQSGPLSFDIVTLQQNVIATLNQTAKKASTFQGLKPIVLYSLYDLKKTTDTYGAAITKRLSPTYQMFAPDIIGSIDDAFDRAIKAYR